FPFVLGARALADHAAVDVVLHPPDAAFLLLVQMAHVFSPPFSGWCGGTPVSYTTSAPPAHGLVGVLRFSGLRLPSKSRSIDRVRPCRRAASAARGRPGGERRHA